jgi:alkanesulfonate monooxygenase SsuD/methylene tetrahydromethanopterin reductase-like flavin-dependent oxidoreductase (luciferase family)
VFCTVHVPLLHPIIAAKQMATVDHVGKGRLGVNVVCGWNEDEFQMFGIDKHEHDDRYAQGEEWWTIIERVWSGEPAFDFHGRFYDLAGVQGQPTPYAGEAPLMMNAGVSVPGRQFAVDLSDLHFDAVRTPDEDTERVAESKRQARERGRALQVWTPPEMHWVAPGVQVP